MRNIWCNIGLHDTYSGSYQTGAFSKHTGDHIGRHEKRCLNCNKKVIFIGQFAREFQEDVWSKLNLKHKPKYIQYQDDDWLDIETKIRLAGNGVN